MKIGSKGSMLGANMVSGNGKIFTCATRYNIYESEYHRYQGSGKPILLMLLLTKEISYYNLFIVILHIFFLYLKESVMNTTAKQKTSSTLYITQKSNSRQRLEKIPLADRLSTIKMETGREDRLLQVMVLQLTKIQQ